MAKKTKLQHRKEYMDKHYSGFADQMLDLADQLNDEKITTHYYLTQSKEIAYNLIQEIVDKEVESYKTMAKARASKKK